MCTSVRKSIDLNLTSFGPWVIFPMVENLSNIMFLVMSPIQGHRISCFFHESQPIKFPPSKGLRRGSFFRKLSTFVCFIIRTLFLHRISSFFLNLNKPIFPPFVGQQQFIQDFANEERGGGTFLHWRNKKFRVFLTRKC